MNNDDVISILQRLVTDNTKDNMTIEQQYYVNGLADALQTVKDMTYANLTIGNHYFVITKDCNDAPVVCAMELYKINRCKAKTAYCFKSVHSSWKYPIVVLYSKSSLTKRVFQTEELARKAFEN